MTASRPVAALAVVLGVTASLPECFAQEPVRISTRIVYGPAKIDPLAAHEPSGRFAYQIASRGRVTNLQGGALFDGAEVASRGTFDLVNGTGTGHGFNVVTKGGDAVTSQWTGVCATFPRSDAKPLIQCAGGFFLVPGSGTGRFAGLAASGSWKGQVTPSGEFEEINDALYTTPQK